jgi:hypothetical protein
MSHFKLTYSELETWLINAFNGEWLKIENPKPLIDLDRIGKLIKKAFV